MEETYIYNDSNNWYILEVWYGQGGEINRQVTRYCKEHSWKQVDRREPERMTGHEETMLIERDLQPYFKWKEEQSTMNKTDFYLEEKFRLDELPAVYQGGILRSYQVNSDKVSVNWILNNIVLMRNHIEHMKVAENNLKKFLEEKL